MKTNSMRVVMGAVTALMATMGVACGPMDQSGATVETETTGASALVFSRAGNTKSTLRLAPNVRMLPNVNVTPTTVKPPPATPNQCAAAGEPGALVQVSAAPTEGLATRTAPRHVISETPRLFLTAVLRNVCGAHVGSFDLYTPSGAFYTRLSTPFSTSGGVATNPTGQIVELELPVAGTEIEARGLVGTWSINYVQDGSDLALGLGEFELVHE